MYFWERKKLLSWGWRFKGIDEAREALEEIIRLTEDEKAYGEAHQGVRVLCRNLNDLINRMAEQDEQVSTQRKRINPINWAQTFNNRKDAKTALEEILVFMEEKEYGEAYRRVQRLYHNLHDLISKTEMQTQNYMRNKTK